MIDVELTENAPARSVEMADSAGRALDRSGLVTASPDPENAGKWLVRAKKHVGVAAVQAGDGEPVTIRIAPKVPIARLLFLLGYRRKPDEWRDEHVQIGDERDLIPVFARIFTREAEHALQQGVLKGYREADETAMVVRGRVRQAEQIRRHHGHWLPLEVTHDEYTADIVENQLLRSACEVLLRLPGGITEDARQRLSRLRLRLGDVTPIPRGYGLSCWQPSRLNVRYHHALRLADLVLRGESVEHQPGDVTVHGFLLSLWTVFEDFVTVSLRDALAEYDGYSHLQATHYLDESQAIRMRPDFVQYAADGTPLAVADAKYKAEKREGFPDADLYQVLAYCTALHLREGHLIYAKGNAPHGAHRVRHAGILLHQHAIDLDQPPSGVLADIQAVAQILMNS